MSRRAGQVTSGQAVAGLLLVLLLAAALVAGLSTLIEVDEVDFDADSEAGAPLPCPAPVRPGGEPVTVSAGELVECPDTYNGATVRYTGEAVGMVLRRGRRAWVQLNDDAYALSAGPLPEHGVPLGANAGTAVSVPVGVADAIEEVGGHDAAGARLEVVGTYLRADPADGGAPAIRAELVEVLHPGRRISHRVHVPRAMVAGGLSIVTLAAALGLQTLRRRQLR